MPAYLGALASAVPSNAYSQQEILEAMRAWHGGDRRTSRILGGIYRNSAIRKRHSVVPDFQPGHPGGLFVDGESGAFRNPGTRERNDAYRREATSLSECAVRRSLGRARTVGAGDVTHLITVSCTGFFAPGPDIELVDALGLPAGVERYHVGFMGCYGAFPALRMARAFCEADADAVVLVVAVELCTLHLQASAEPDSLLGAAVFADGCAAAVVTGRPPGGPSYRLERFATTLARERASDMAWTIGDHGFEMVLSAGLPDAVEAEVAAALAPLLGDGDLNPRAIERWAVHPGGRAILDRVEEALELPAAALAASRSVLADYGNMSSATVLFVLERLLQDPGNEGALTAAVAFGPGLAVESALLARS